MASSRSVRKRVLNSAFAIDGYAGMYEGSYYYSVKASTINAVIFPIFESQTQHIQGYQTTISLTQSVTHTRTASQSLSVGSTIFVSISASLGVSQSQSYTTAATTAYTIPSSMASGKYRIEHVFPQSRLNYSRWDLISLTEEKWTITYAPDTNAAYRRLNRYSN